MDPRRIIAQALGDQPADLVLTNARLVNVLSGEVHQCEVAVAGELVVGLGAPGDYRAEEIVDLDGACVLPGLIEGHIHLESAMVRPAEFARAVLPLGTTSVVYDPHEVANVLGLEGITYLHRVSACLPVDFFAMLPSCVPSSDLETAGAALTVEDIGPLLSEEWVLGLGEVMNFPGVLAGEQGVLDKIEAARIQHKVLDGHAPGLTGKRLNAYAACGIQSDHETTDADEARAKLRAGLHLMIREGSTERNLDTLLQVVTPENSRRCMFVSDDRHPLDLVRGKHLGDSVRRAIAAGLPVVDAVQMASLNTARYFGLRDRGAVAPGLLADLVVVGDPAEMDIQRVYKRGKLVAADGRALDFSPDHPKAFLRGSINVRWIEPEDFYLPANGQVARVIEIVPGQIVTRATQAPVKVVGGRALPDPEADLAKIAVVERHRGSGRTALGFVRGFGLRRGAIASSVAHDAHNIVVVGANDADIYEAAVRIVKLSGGLVAVEDGQVLASLRCPIAGLMSDRPLSEVAEGLDALLAAARQLGCELEDPFGALSFLCLPVIPSLKITDRGLVDTDSFKVVDLWVE